MEDYEDPLDLLGDDGDGVIEACLLEEEEKRGKNGGNNNSGCCLIFLALSLRNGEKAIYLMKLELMMRKIPC